MGFFDAAFQISLLVCAFALSFSLLASSAHLIFAGVRMVLGRPPNLKGIIVIRALSSMFVLLAWLITTVQVERGQILVDAQRVVFISLLTLPMAIPLLDLLIRKRTSSLLLAVSCVMAFPITIGYAVNSIFYDAMKDPERIVQEFGSTERVAQLYETRPQDEISPDLQKFLGLPEAPQQQRWTSREWDTQHALAWVDLTADTISIGALTYFRSHFSGQRIRQTDEPLLQVIFFLFAALYASLFWSTAYFLLRALVRLIVDHATLGGVAELEQ